MQAHLQELYGVEVSPTFISTITGKLLVLVEEWQARPLAEIYGRLVTKAAYTCLGIDATGHKDLLGRWLGGSEGANFWLAILTELRNRGVQDVLIACVDGLKGFPEAIQSVHPGAAVQCCIIHQIRTSWRYGAWQNHKEFRSDLKKVYTALTESQATHELDNPANTWGQNYPVVVNSWQRNWPQLSTFLTYR